MPTKGITFTDTDTGTVAFQLPGLVSQHDVGSWERQVVRRATFNVSGFTRLNGKRVSRQIVMPVFAFGPWSSDSARLAALNAVMDKEGTIGTLEVANYAGVLTHTFELCEFEKYRTIKLSWDAAHGYFAVCQMSFLQIGSD